MRPTTVLLLSLATILRAATLIAADEDTALRIGLSPAAEKKAQIEANVALYKSAIAGTADAQKSWDELKPEDRNRALAAVAWSKADAPLRERAIRTLAKNSPSDDADGTGLKALATVAVAEGDGTLPSRARP